MVIMKKHNGMRPQDIVVLLKIISIRDDKWRNIDIANAIGISPSEVSEALNRCKIAKLIDSKKRKVNISVIDQAEDLKRFIDGKVWVKLGDISLIINTKGEIVP